VRRIFWIIAGLWLGGLFVAAATETYPLTDGTALTGDVVSYSDNGVLFHLTEGDKYTQRIPWTKFSQEALQKLAENPKIKPLADPFIEAPPTEKQTEKAQVKLHEVSRLELPPRQSLFGTLFSSSVGLVALMLIYAANVFAGYEIAVVRAQPILLVMGAVVVLPILGPLIFLVMPARVESAAPAAVRPDAAAHSFAVPSAAAPVAAGIHIVEASWQKEGAAAGQSAGQVFQRGQFTFNRRFFETKFSGFFSLIRREAEKNLVLTVKTGRATHVVERITRISANEMHVEIGQGPLKKEIMVPFAEIVEVQLQPKNG
jgi:hypothetical protein